MILLFWLGEEDEFCKNALDLSNGTGTLTIANEWSVGMYCQWELPIEDDKSYITIEFQHLNVSIAIHHLQFNIAHFGFEGYIG